MAASTLELHLKKEVQEVTAGTTLSSILGLTKTEELWRLSLAWLQIQLSKRNREREKKTQITLGISLQLSLKPVPHYHASVICIAYTPSTPCEPVNLLIYCCHSFNASDLLIYCICEYVCDILTGC